MKLAIMQPYFFPYIGYWQLINAVDTFVIYDDVNFIKQGWINRNRILLNNKAHFITLNLKGASSFKKINEIYININSKKILKTIFQAYKKAPYFSEIFPRIENIICFEENNLAKFVINSIIEIVRYLGIDTNLIISSEKTIGSSLKGRNRVLKICKYFNATQYLNAIGGQNLYSKEEFKKNNIELLFLKTKKFIYKQFNNEFEPNLSIIDVMMFNSKEEIKRMLNEYELI